MINAIVCVDKNWGIGKNNDLLFNLKEDMKFFREKTKNSIVFCGYNTLLSFPGSKPLKNRSTIVLCPKEVERDDCFCIHDFDEAVRLLKELSKTQEVFVIGGAMVYKSMLPYYDRVYVTHVDADGQASVFFPNLLLEEGYYLKEKLYNTLDGNYQLTFTVYERRD
jgi:dihydrofolate reductase